jgi:acyl-CoA synthetase (AMP-forming)/AMP-acid ligase II
VLDQPSSKQKVGIPFSSLYDLLLGHAQRFTQAPAILAPDCAPLSYQRLFRHIDDIGRTLRAKGIGRGDRVAVLMPNGPELAVAIVAMAANAACASINPAYSAEELDRYFTDLKPRALIVPAKVDLPARRVARARGVPVLELTPTGEAAGLFTLAGAAAGNPSSDPVGPGTIALFLFTSGTTSRPKIVPLSHANICTSAFSAVAALQLSEADRCLNVLPLFHGHGLIATVMTSLAAGGGVVCTPGCDVNRFFGWLREFAPTWYSAVPTMHQAILAQARLNPDQVAGIRLRLVRSASAPLPPRVFAELERTFGTSVIEFYGMTETASAPIACNPLPPRRSKPGSVGTPVGLDVAIMDDRGDVLPAGQAGHVTVRGGSVMPGYDGDAAATAAAFAGDWFKTGDQGFFDDEGYLYLSGRTREMINRGGENIAPREVDEALLEHPAVAEAVTFAVPHATLGEDVAAAVVLRPNVDATVKDIRQFVAGRLADFKVPRQVLIVEQLPKGSTGKIQRIGLAEKLGLAGSAASRTFAAPRTPLESILTGIWADVLRLEQVGIHDDFFTLGGDSLLAAHVLTSIHDAMHLEVGVVSLFDAPTVAEMAEYLETLIKAGRAGQPEIARVSRNETLPASPAQERLWTLQQAVPDLPFFNILYALRVTSPLDATLLECSLNEIVRRHEILRTTIGVAGGRQIQVIAPRLTVPLAVDDLHKLSTSKREKAAHRLVQAELLHSFDLALGPLIRARVVQLAEDEYLLLITMHQMIADGGSLGVIAEELAALYEAFSTGKALPLPPPLQYADFAAWQYAWESHSNVAAQLDYWREQLRGPLPALKLGVARSRRAASELTAQRDIALPASLTEVVKQFSRREGGTLFMALVAALKTLLHRYAGDDDLRLATNVANRNRAGTEGLIGPLANTVILRTDLGGDPTAREVMRRVRATTLDAYAHQDLPFEVVGETLARENGLDPAQLAQVMILLHNAAVRPQTSAGRALAFEEADPGMPMPLVTTTTYDVIFVLRETAQGLVGSCIYKPHLFGLKSIDRLLADFQKILKQMASEPERRISTIRIARKVRAKRVTT